MVVGERFGVSGRTVASWRQGTRSPPWERRQAIRGAGGPEEIAWDEPLVSAEAAVAPVVVVAGSATAERTASIADTQMALVLQCQEQLRAADLTLPQRVTLLEKTTSMIRTLGQLTGASVSDERQIMRSPAFVALMRGAAEALAAYPDALRALAAWMVAEKGDAS